MPGEKISVLFCCLGNICRSPLAEAIFADYVTRNGLQEHFDLIDSCGTADYHEGEEPDMRWVRGAGQTHTRTTAICRDNNIPINSLARAVKKEDFDKFDYIFGMDSNNVKNLRKMQPPGSKARVMLFSEFDDKKTIYDPYYIGDDAFHTVHEQCVRYTQAFLKSKDLRAASQL